MAILGLLADQNLHGYEIRRRVGQILGPISRLSFGTLYPALNRLETDGLVEVLRVSSSRTGLTTTRGRKVYGRTEKGRETFEELLAASTVDDERDFTLRLTFAGHLSSEARVRLLTRRKEQLSERLELEREALEERSARLDEYSRSVLEHRVQTLASDLTWLDHMIANEQKRSLNNNAQTGNLSGASRRGK